MLQKLLKYKLFLTKMRLSNIPTKIKMITMACTQFRCFPIFDKINNTLPELKKTLLLFNPLFTHIHTYMWNVFQP